MNIKFNLLYNGAKMPQRGHDVDVGLDTFTPKGGLLVPGINVIPLGFGCEVPVGYGGFIFPRGGMASGVKTLDMELSIMGRPQGEKTYVRDLVPQGISIIAHIPPIDPGYTGEVNLMVTNNSNYYIKYNQHTRFGQLVFFPITYVNPVLNVDLSRGDGKFGSTGIGGTVC